VVVAALFITVPFFARAEDNKAPDKSDYMPVIRQELARLELQAFCDDAERFCRYKKSIGKDGPNFEIVVRYSQKTDTVYIYIESFLDLDGEEPSKDLALKLLEINREMVTAKFEWDRTAGSIRLSVTINTDSNFDRRAFRSQLKGIWTAAQRVWPIVSGLQKTPVD